MPGSVRRPLGETHAGISFVLFDPAGRRSTSAVADPAERHLYRSTDGGATWAAVAGRSGAARCCRSRADLDGRGNLYIAYSTGIGPNGIKDGSLWRLDTRSGRWTDITPDPGRPKAAIWGSASTASGPAAWPSRASTAGSPGDTVWLSEDFGRSWTDLGPRSRRDISISPWLRLRREGAGVRPLDRRPGDRSVRRRHHRLHDRRDALPHRRGT